MPSASSAKLVKQASTEAPDPLRQGIIIIEHKIRNLEKRKGKLDGYRATKESGKTLQSEQAAALAKYEEVIQTLEFARDLCKQLNQISADAAKLAKKQARKDALERHANDLSRIKQVLLIQNALNQIGTDAVREDFLSGQNGACQLADSDLQLFDTFYETVTPKAYDDAKASVDEQISAAAEHYLFAIDGKPKEFGGVTYAVFKEKISAVHACGYFDKPVVEPVTETPAEDVEAVGGDLNAEIPVEEPIPAPEVVNPTFQAPPAVIPVLAPHQMPAQPPVPVPLRPHDVINSVTSGSFNFLQESELDSPDPTVPPPAHPIPSAIPTQTYTNQSFVPQQVNPPPASAVPMFHQPQHPPPPHMQPVHQLPGENFNASNPPANLPIPPQSHLAPISPNASNPNVMYQQQIYSPERYDQPRNDHVNDNHPVESQLDQSNQPARQNPVSNKWTADTDDWNNSNDDWNNQQGSQNDWSNNSNNNDGGYQTQRRDRGDREQRGRGKPRGQYNGYGGRGRGGSGGDRPYQQNDRPFYRNNNSEGGNNYYQNGYNKDGQGGGYRGRGGADRARPNRGGMDRGGPRGAPRGNSRGRGGGTYRGGQTGGQGIPSGGAGPKQ